MLNNFNCFDDKSHILHNFFHLCLKIKVTLCGNTLIFTLVLFFNVAVPATTVSESLSMSSFLRGTVINSGFWHSSLTY